MRDADYYSVGIDPGVSGGVCILSPQRTIIAAAKTPESELGLWLWLDQEVSRVRLYADGRDTKIKACIEKVGGYIPRDRSGQHGKDAGDRGSHMFVFGRSYGGLVMALVALNLYPYKEVTPQMWQRFYEIPPRGKAEKSEAFKRRLKTVADAKFPNDKLTLHTCDAALLALYRSLT